MLQWNDKYSKNCSKIVFIDSSGYPISLIEQQSWLLVRDPGGFFKESIASSKDQCKIFIRLERTIFKSRSKHAVKSLRVYKHKILLYSLK